METVDVVLIDSQSTLVVVMGFDVFHDGLNVNKVLLRVTSLVVLFVSLGEQISV